MCNDDWAPVEGDCVKVVRKDLLMNFDAASELCNNQGAELYQPYNTGREHYMETYMSTSYEVAWLGRKKVLLFLNAFNVVLSVSFDTGKNKSQFCV